MVIIPPSPNSIHLSFAPNLRNPYIDHQVPTRLDQERSNNRGIGCIPIPSILPIRKHRLLRILLPRIRTHHLRRLHTKPSSNRRVNKRVQQKLFFPSLRTLRTSFPHINIFNEQVLIRSLLLEILPIISPRCRISQK